MGAHTFDPVAQSVLDSIRRIVHALRLFDREAERRVGLSGAQTFVLQKLGDLSGVSVNELADRTHTHQSSVSVVVQKLVDRKLVRRSFSAKDARRAELSLSARGRRVLGSAPAAAQDRLITALGALPRVRRRQLDRLLGEVIQKTGMELQPATLFFEEAPARSKKGRGRKAISRKQK